MGGGYGGMMGGGYGGMMGGGYGMMRNPFAMPHQHYPMANTFGLGRYGRPTPYGYGAEMAIHHDGLHNGAGYGAAAQAAQYAMPAQPAQPAQELVGLGQPQMKQQLV